MSQIQTLQQRVQMAFAMEPPGFPIVTGSCEAVSHTGAVLQTPTANRATLTCQMPHNNPALVRRNVNLLVLLGACADLDLSAWLQAEFLAVGKKTGRRSVKIENGRRCDLIIDRPHQLTTLTIQQGSE